MRVYGSGGGRMRKNDLIGPDAAEFYQDNSCSPTDFRIVVSAMVTVQISGLDKFRRMS